MEGLSICVPVYNWEVTRLVRELHEQASQINIPFEIVVADDCSTVFRQENKRASEELSSARYLLMEQNVGRARIRNILVEKATYDWLLFMDCDVEVCSESYVKDYWEQRRAAQLIVGGCTYRDEKPSREYLLRWTYGMAVEKRSAEERNKSPFQSFVPFNFMIERDLLRQIPFDERFSQYGHEDTLLGWQMQEHGVTIKHIDNPLIHLGVDKTEIFLRKTRQAVDNLRMVYNDAQTPQGLLESIHLLKFYGRMKQRHLVGVVRCLTSFSETPVLYNLRSGHPSVRLFQWYKLGYFLKRMG